MFAPMLSTEEYIDEAYKKAKRKYRIQYRGET